LSTGLSAEIVSRISGNISLNTGLSSEIGLRQSGDVSLSIALSNEIIARMLGDASSTFNMVSSDPRGAFEIVLSTDGSVNSNFPTVDLHAIYKYVSSLGYTKSYAMFRVLCDTFNTNNNPDKSTCMPFTVNNGEVQINVPMNTSYAFVSPNKVEHIGYVSTESISIPNVTTSNLGSPKVLKTISLSRGTYIIEATMSFLSAAPTTEPYSVMFGINDSTTSAFSYSTLYGCYCEQNYIINSTSDVNYIQSKLTIQINAISTSLYIIDIFRGYNNTWPGNLTQRSLSWTCVRIA
jgi:hypothetical protein